MNDSKHQTPLMSAEEYVLLRLCVVHGIRAFQASLDVEAEEKVRELYNKLFGKVSRNKASQAYMANQQKLKQVDMFRCQICGAEMRESEATTVSLDMNKTFKRCCDECVSLLSR